MNDLLKYLTSTFRTIHSKTYYDINRSEQVSYPYCTFDVDSSMNEDRNQETISIDFDIFDLNTSYINILEVETKLKSQLAYKREMNKDFGAIWSFVRSTNIPTGQDTLLRRSLQFEIIIDWRTL